MLATMPRKHNDPRQPRPDASAPKQERPAYSHGKTVLDSFIEQLMDSEDPRALIDAEIKRGILMGEQKRPGQILSTLRELDTLHTFSQRVAYINDRGAKGAIDEDIYRAFSMAIIRMDVRETRQKRESTDQTPLKWAYYWRRTNALADQLEKPGGCVSFGDIQDIRDRFHAEPLEIQNTIRDRIGGIALACAAMTESERTRNRLSLERIIQTAEMLYDEEQARTIRYAHDLAAKLQEMGIFEIKKTKISEAPKLTRGIFQVLAEKMMPQLEQSVRAHFQGKKSSLTPEETGILSAETKSLLYFLLNTENRENKEMRRYFWQLIEDQRHLEETLRLAQEGLSAEIEEKQYALEATLPSRAKAQLTDELRDTQSAIQALQGRLTALAALDAQTSEDALRYIDELDMRETLESAISSLELNPSRERRERARIADAVSREEQARSWTEKEETYATLKAAIKGRSMLDYAAEQRAKMGEESEGRRQTGKSSRLRHKRQALVGELHKIGIYKERLAPLANELQGLNDEESSADAMVTLQLERLNTRHDEIAAKRKRSAKLLSEIERIETEIDRVSAEWTQSKAQFSQRRERIEHSMRPLEQTVGSEQSIRDELARTEEMLSKIIRRTPKTRLERIRTAQQKADVLLTATADEIHSAEAEGAKSFEEEDEEKSLLNPNWHLLYRPGRKRGQGTGRIVDRVLERIAHDNEEREERKRARQAVRNELFDILNSQFGSRKRAREDELDEILDTLEQNKPDIEVASNDAMDFFTMLQSNVRELFIFDQDGPVVYWREQRIRLPKFLAQRLTNHLLAHSIARTNEQWQAVKYDLTNREKLGELEPALKDIRHLASLQRYLTTYAPAFRGRSIPRTQEHGDKRETAQEEMTREEKKMRIVELLLPKFYDRSKEAIREKFNDDRDKMNLALNIVEELHRKVLTKAEVADDVRDAVYSMWNLDSHDVQAYYDAYGSDLEYILINVFENVFPNSVFSSEQHT